MPFINLLQVADVTDEVVIARLKELALLPPSRSRRGSYQADADDPNQYRWVLARNVGASRRRDQRLFHRLVKMAESGLIEQKKPFYGYPTRFRPKA